MSEPVSKSHGARAQQSADASPAPPSGDSGSTTAIVAVAATALVLAIGALAFYGWDSAKGVAVGGGIAVANLLALAWIGRGVLQSSGGRRRIWGVVGFVKVFALLGFVLWLVQSDLVPVLPLIVGYAALPVGIGLGGLLGPRGGAEAPSDKADTGGDRKEVIGGRASSTDDDESSD